MTYVEGQSPPTTQPNAGTATSSDAVCLWLTRVISAFGILVTAWAAWATGPMLIHGHPAYTVLLAAVLGVSAVCSVLAWRPRPAAPRRFKVLRAVLMAVSFAIIATCAWLVPFSATEPALSAMRSDAAVTVTETPTGITFSPAGQAHERGVFFQPGARVDARAYAAVLRPLAESGYRVWIPKQPLGIAFLSTGAFDTARDAADDISSWVVGGHSLGGTVAAINADSFSGSASDPVIGLMLYASYPATDMSALSARVLSISGSLDGLATPAKIEASQMDLPADTSYVVVDGAVHSFFGDYGQQPGDGVPSISHDAARKIISDESLSFLESLPR